MEFVCLDVESRIYSTGLVVIFRNFVIVPVGNGREMMDFGVRSFVNESDWTFGVTWFLSFDEGVLFIEGGCLKGFF